MLNILCKQLRVKGRVNIRHCSVTKPKIEPEPTGLSYRPDPHEVDSDYIGPPDPNSNLRPYVRHIAKDETPLQKRFRLKQLEVEAWNQDFWTKHNKRFFEEKDEFIRLHKLTNNDEMSADKLSIFYKHFLDKNWKLHLWYALSWYIKNYHLLILAFQVAVQKLFNKIKKRRK